MRGSIFFGCHAINRYFPYFHISYSRVGVYEFPAAIMFHDDIQYYVWISFQIGDADKTDIATGDDLFHSLSVFYDNSFHFK